MEAYHFAVTYEKANVAEFIVTAPEHCFGERIAMGIIDYLVGSTEDLKIRFYGEVKVNPSKLPIDTVAVLYLDIAQPNPYIPAYLVKRILNDFSAVSPGNTENLFDIKS